MCAQTSFKRVQYKPKSMIPVSSAKKLEGTAHWGEKGGLQRAFSRSETADQVWRAKGWDVDLDHPIDQFSERDRRNNELVHKDVPEGTVIYMLGKRETGEAVMLTRDATPQEREFFGHKRCPVTGPRRFGNQATFSLDTEDM